MLILPPSRMVRAMEAGWSRKDLRKLSLYVGDFALYRSVAIGAISVAHAVDILELKREAQPWWVKLLRYLLGVSAAFGPPRHY